MRPHHHLIELLAAFKVQKDDVDEYSFLFPWAEGRSLKHMWTREPQEMLCQMLPTQAHLPQTLLFWISKQCYGLIDGLRTIHDIRIKAYKRMARKGLLEDDVNEKAYGIHGDIKPENLLYFSQIDDGTGLGTLKIADFGLTEFHTMRSRTAKARADLFRGGIPHGAPTYEAPEQSLDDGYYSRKVDIWAFGCVFSQFLTWAILGPDSVRIFDNQRKEERDITYNKQSHEAVPSRIVCDNFFRREKSPEGKVTTFVKESVKQVSGMPFRYHRGISYSKPHCMLTFCSSG
jgi:serine/threonine protein kinase